MTSPHRPAALPWHPVSVEVKQTGDTRAGVAATRPIFIALCLYLLVQAYTIPVLPFGPSWAIWPTLPDLVSGLLLVTALLTRPPVGAVSQTNRSLLWGLLAIYGGALISFLTGVWYNTIFNLDTWTLLARGVQYGAAQLYRLALFLIVFWITAHIPLTTQRWRALKIIITFVLVVVCVGVMLTYLGVVPMSLPVSHLPADPGLSGPWADFHELAEDNLSAGWGTISYSHAYLAAHVLLLLALRLYLARGRQPLLDGLLIILANVAVFLSESRAGLAAALLFTGLYLLRRPALVLLVILLLGVLVIAPFAGGSLPFELQSDTLERSLSLLQPQRDPDLSGRTAIWRERIRFLNDRPLRWLTGVGFGRVAETGDDAHMLYLHIILETGIIGLMAFCALAAYVLRALWERRHEARPIFLVTIALLVASLTQETFYPVVSQGSFLGFYLATLALIFARRPGEQQPTAHAHERIVAPWTSS